MLSRSKSVIPPAMHAGDAESACQNHLPVLKDGDAQGYLPLMPTEGDASGFLLASNAPAPMPDPGMRETSVTPVGQSSQSKDASGPPLAVLALCPPPLAGRHTESLAARPLPGHIPAQPLSHHLAAWRLLPGVSRWVLRTIQFGYHTPVPPPPSLLQWGSPHCQEQNPRCFCSTAKSNVPPPEGSDRGGSSGLCLRLNAQKSVLTSSQQTTFLGVQLDSLPYAGPSGPISSFQSLCVLGPLQARPSCSSGHMSQASEAHGSSLACAALRSPS
ncbi:hypothetical protein PO909_015267 [Leuciscus waleckii]